MCCLGSTTDRCHQRADDAGQFLEALDRKREVQAELKRDGIVIKNRAGELRPHPAASIERDSRLAVLRCLRALGLPLSEEVDKRKSGRPPRSYPEMVGEAQGA